jgi:hypothetical protein
MNGMSD